MVPPSVVRVDAALVVADRGAACVVLAELQLVASVKAAAISTARFIGASAGG
jgi:hypothetical protein